jgi:hypothetical protein
MLDYFFLQVLTSSYSQVNLFIQPGYYRLSYGMNWPSNVSLLFTVFDQMKVVLLPVDNLSPSSELLKVIMIIPAPS